MKQKISQQKVEIAVLGVFAVVVCSIGARLLPQFCAATSNNLLGKGKRAVGLGEEGKKGDALYSLTAGHLVSSPVF
jgi:hypothetical protein